MNEKVTAYSLDVRPKVFDRVDRIRLYAGGTETKYLFSGHDVISTHDTSFVERIFDPEIIKKWKRMKSVGLPVAPDLLLNPMKNFMLFTDVKADGSEVYGKGFKWCLEFSDIATRERPRLEIDERFLDLTAPQNFFTIERAVEGIVNTANAHSIELPNDDPMELIIHPDGTWGLIILDLARARVDLPRNLFEAGATAAKNRFYSENFLRNLKDIRGLLTSDVLTVEEDDLFL